MIILKIWRLIRRRRSLKQDLYRELFKRFTAAMRRVRVREDHLNPEEENQVVALVREEVDEIMVAKVSKEVEGVTEFEVKICLGELKEMDEGEVTEAMLLQRVMQQKEEGELLK